MWLLNVSSLTLKEFHGTHFPAYGILSHTWDEDEVTFQEMQDTNRVDRDKAGYEKVRRLCELAKTHSLEYVWVDTCCIDKRSSAELTEAINSMFGWYKNAALCFIYLADVPSTDCDVAEDDSTSCQSSAFEASRWFTRGWTLQELLASSKRIFVASDWTVIDSVAGKSPVEVCSSITGIAFRILLYPPRIREICIATRMSWAAERQTTRPEDGAYSLMGIFNVKMPILYGEGLRGAFRRLQEEILKKSFDQSIFAWRNPRYISSGLLAHGPEDFAETPQLVIRRPDMIVPFSITNVGVLMRACIFPDTDAGPRIFRAALQCNVKTPRGWMCLVILVMRMESIRGYVAGESRQVYRRVACKSFATISRETLDKLEYVDILVLEDEHHELIQSSSVDDFHRLSEEWGTEPQILRRHDPKTCRIACCEPYRSRRGSDSHPVPDSV